MRYWRAKLAVPGGPLRFAWPSPLLAALLSWADRPSTGDPHPERRARVAQSITDEGSKASALVRVAEAVATDPDRAARLIADAERIAQSITLEFAKARRSDVIAMLELRVTNMETRRAELLPPPSPGGMGASLQRQRQIVWLLPAASRAAPDRGERVWLLSKSNTQLLRRPDERDQLACLGGRPRNRTI